MITKKFMMFLILVVLASFLIANTIRVFYFQEIGNIPEELGSLTRYATITVAGVIVADLQNHILEKQVAFIKSSCLSRISVIIPTTEALEMIDAIPKMISKMRSWQEANGIGDKLEITFRTPSGLVFAQLTIKGGLHLRIGDIPDQEILLWYSEPQNVDKLLELVKKAVEWTERTMITYKELN